MDAAVWLSSARGLGHRKVRTFDSLRRARDFDRLFASGRRVADRLLVVISAPGEAGRSRVAFVVGKRVGGAVVRNRLRRRLREAFRALSHRLPSEGVDLVVLGRGPAGAAPYQRLAESLQRLLTRAGLLGPEPEPGALDSFAGGGRETVYLVYVGPGTNHGAIYQIQDEVFLVVVVKVGDRK